IILLPEVPFRETAFIAKVREWVDTIGRCVVVVSEGTRYADGSYISEQRGEFAKDAFGHVQLGGAANFIKNLVEREVKVKARFAFPSTIQRSGAHFASKVDSEEAYLAGRTAVELAVSGENGKMVTLVRSSGSPYHCGTGTAALSEVANGEKLFPAEWISDDGFGVADAFIEYARPLIQGELPVSMKDGLPDFMRFEKHFI
ncbi:MAG: 6-phosphofructokinase, partial [Spirochaetaceae bacterium]|nr:6-phosphofructokinase [Spirochaetaceae bacterium]